MYRIVLVLVLSAALTPAARLLAQEAPPLREDFRRGRPALYTGDVVRITAPDAFPAPIEGRVVGFGSDSLIVEGRREAEGRTAVPLESITRLELLDESTSGIGAVFGVLAGVAVGATLAGELASDASDLVRSLAVVGGAMVGGFGGYWGGVRIERLLSGDKWQPIPLSQVQVGVGPTLRGGLAFVVTYTF